MHLPRRSFLNALVILALMAGFFSLTPAALPARAATSDLFFSEYIEGSSNNKALEIYNGTGAAVDLAAGGYKIQIFYNSATTAGSTIDLSGVIADGDVFIIANSAAALNDIKEEADVLTGSISFNGDDAVTLTKNGVVIDAIGQIGFDGSEWGTGDESTTDNTLVRKPGVCQGDSDASDVFDPAVEWYGFTQNTSDDLGKHTANCDGPVTQPPLLLTEIVVTPTGGEFIEIYNPGSAAVDLSNVYLTDATYASGGTYYYNLPTGANAGGGAFTDFNARFPDGASNDPGDYKTVALNGAVNYATAYGTNPTYELYELVIEPAVPNMREALPGSINNQGGLTNAGEVVVLYTWDGASDLVADLDYAVWGAKAEAVDKTGVAIDGPDADTDASPYLNDTPIASQAVVAAAAHPLGGSFQRQDLAEGAEVKTGGNGLTGHDETSEDADVTWCSPTTATPGAVSAACPVVSACGDPATLISAIQGAGAASPFDGAAHTIEGIVVADFQNTGELNGIFVQEETSDQDADPLTSEGVFVYGAPAAAVGDVVRVAGTVDEYNGLTELTSVTALEVCSSANPLPAPVVLSPPFPTLDYLERYEGMYVELPAGLTVTELYTLGRYGEIWLTNGARLDQPTNVVEPGAPALALQASNDLNRILLDDHSTYQNPDPVIHPAPALSPVDNYVRAGDTSTVPIVGALSYGFDYYRVQPVTPTSFTGSNPRPVQPLDVGGSLKVASFNMLNYFNGDGLGGGVPTARGAGSLEEFQHQTAKIAAAITTMDADIVGLMEIENDGYGPESAIQDLVDALNAIVGPGTYAFIDPGVGPVGTDE
ncbi:MAG TPA: ExeM/NucH family extracellular endonuclease, partial [Anaerolineales bacterium]|nr:ExeM/NucH family extracellular endonuclease [Anaerolineales bacterium]